MASSSVEFQSPSAVAPPWRERWVHGRDVLRELIARDMHLRYRGSMLGMAWTLLNPLAELLVLSFIFNAVLPVNIPNYSAFLFTGLLAYGWFSTALILATGTIVNNRELINRPGVPIALLPIVTACSTLLHFLMSLPVLIALLLLTRVAITPVVLLLPAIIVVQFILILSLAYPLATVNVWFRDTPYFLRVGLQLLFYLTPVFYDASMVPERFRAVFYVNPLVYVIDGYRAVLVYGKLPAAMPLTLLALASGVGLAAGLAVFRGASYRFPDEL
jgi:homopolymeric O-antigen transport system permease protein